MVGESETVKKCETRFTSIRLVKQEDFCGAMALTCFVEKIAQIYLDGI